MALRAGYKGIKKVGSGLSLSTDGVLSSTGGGETALSDLSDVSIISPSDGQVLQYDATSQKWVNGSGGNVPPRGSTATPTDDIQTWLNCGNIWDKSYTTIDEVLADSTILLALILSNNAADYMARSTTWVSAVTANSTAMTDIGANNYCADTLLDDSTWRTAICNSTYFESVLNVKVPTMTNNTTPSGYVASADGEYSESTKAYVPFSGVEDRYVTWTSNHLKNTQGIYLQIKLPSQTKVPLMKILWPDTWTACEYKVQGSNDGTSFTDIGTFSDTISGFSRTSHILNNSNKYLYYRIAITSQTGSNTYGGNMSALQFYGRA